MATSKQGQDAVTCQLCEETFEVEWKCLTCQFFMCTRCCKIHEKFKSLDRHDIVNIKDGSTIKEVKEDFSDIKCGLHNGQSYCLFCQKCEELVCPSCVAKTHNTHKMLELTEGNKLMLNKLKERKIELENENENKASHLKSLRETERSIYEKERKKIFDHSKVLKGAVDEQIRTLLDDLDQKWNEQDQSFREEEKRLEVQRQEKKKRIETLTSAIRSENLNDVFKNFRKEKGITEETVFPKFPKLPSFEADKITSAKIVSVCGTFKHCEIGVSSKRLIDLTIDGELQFRHATVFNVLLNGDESIWINDRNSKSLLKVDISSTNEVGKKGKLQNPISELTKDFTRLQSMLCIMTEFL